MVVVLWIVDRLLAPIMAGLVVSVVVTLWGRRHVRDLHARLDVQDEHLAAQDTHLDAQDTVLKDLRGTP